MASSAIRLSYECQHSVGDFYTCLSPHLLFPRWPNDDLSPTGSPICANAKGFYSWAERMPEAKMLKTHPRHPSRLQKKLARAAFRDGLLYDLCLRATWHRWRHSVLSHFLARPDLERGNFGRVKRKFANRYFMLRPTTHQPTAEQAPKEIKIGRLTRLLNSLCDDRVVGIHQALKVGLGLVDPCCVSVDRPLSVLFEMLDRPIEYGRSSERKQNCPPRCPTATSIKKTAEPCAGDDAGLSATDLETKEQCARRRSPSGRHP